MAKDTSKPIRFKTIQKNTKLGEFILENKPDANYEENPPID